MEIPPSSLKFHLGLILFGPSSNPVSFLLCAEYLSSSLSEGHGKPSVFPEISTWDLSSLRAWKASVFPEILPGTYPTWSPDQPSPSCFVRIPHIITVREGMESPPSSLKFHLGLILFGHLIKPVSLPALCEYLSSSLSEGMESPPSSLKLPWDLSSWSPDQTRLLPCFCANTSHHHCQRAWESPPSSLKFHWDLSSLSPDQTCLLPALCEYLSSSLGGMESPPSSPEIPPVTNPLWSPDQNRLLPALCEYLSSSLSEGHGKSSVFPEITTWDLSTLVTSSNPSPSCFVRIPLIITVRGHGNSSGHGKPSVFPEIPPGTYLFGHLIKPISFLVCANTSHHHYQRGMEGPPSSLKFPLGLIRFGHLHPNPSPSALCEYLSSSLSEGHGRSSVFPENSTLVTSSTPSPSCFVRIPHIITVIPPSSLKFLLGLTWSPDQTRLLPALCFITVRGHGKSSVFLKFHLGLILFGHLIKPVSFLLCEYLSSSLSWKKVPPEILLGLILFGHFIKPVSFLLCANTSHHHCQRGMENSSVFLEIPPGTYPLWSPDQTCLLPALCEYFSSSLSEGMESLRLPEIPPGTYPLWSPDQTCLLPALCEYLHHHCQRGHGKSVFPEILPGTYPLWSPDQTRLLPALCEYLSSSLSERHGKPSVFPEILHLGLILFGHLIKPVSFLLCANTSHHHCQRGMESPPGAWKASVFPEIPPGTYPLWSPDQTCLLPALCEYLSSSLSEGMESPPSSLKFYLGLILWSPDQTCLLPGLCEYLSSLSEGHGKPPSSLKFPLGLILFGHLIQPVSFLVCANTSHHHCQRAWKALQGAWKVSVFPLKFHLGLILFGHLHQTCLLPALCEYLSSSLSEWHGKPSVFPEIPPGTYPLWSPDQTCLFLFCEYLLIITVRGAWKASVFPEIPPGTYPLGHGKPSVFPEILPGTYPLWSPDQTRLLPGLCRIHLIITVRGAWKASVFLKFYLGLILFGHLIKPVSFWFVRIPLIITIRGAWKASVFPEIPPGTYPHWSLHQTVSFLLCANTSHHHCQRGMEGPPSSWFCANSPWDLSVFPGPLGLKPVSFPALCRYLSSSLSDGHDPPSSLRILSPSSHQTVPLGILFVPFPKFSRTYLLEGHGKPSVFPEIPPGTYPLWSPHQTCLLPALCEYLSSSLSEGHGKPPSSLKFHLGLILFGHLIKPVSFLLCAILSHHHCQRGMESPPSSLKFYLGLISLVTSSNLSPSCFVRIPLIITVRGHGKSSVFPEIPPGTYPLWSPDQTRLLPGLCEYTLIITVRGHGKFSVFPEIGPSFSFHLCQLSEGMESPPSSLYPLWSNPSFLLLNTSHHPTPPSSFLPGTFLFVP
ncbi:unnamed protein product [Acanthosepion pharaonis]|uniref:Uncharacterized protein n=1 Tax=Acanthosepion pharaonis TaxID=158019 RepID=A0A812CHN9_ACAPH|nr:unnamed protein product [Sepia pharaonis]